MTNPSSLSLYMALQGTAITGDGCLIQLKANRVARVNKSYSSRARKRIILIIFLSGIKTMKRKR